MKIDTRARRIIAAVAVAAAVAVGATACSFDKATEPFQDAPRTGTTNSEPVEVITDADGFSNLATKCDHGNRVYIAFHGDSPYAAIAVVPRDPTCN